MKGMNATASFTKLNAEIVRYANEFKVDLGKAVRYVSVGLIKDVAKGNPVLTGRSRAGWLPFLWKMNVSAPLKSKKKSKKKGWSADIAAAQQEGIMACDYKYNFSDWKPFAMIINNVNYMVYLIYGVRKGEELVKPIEYADLSAVSEQNDPDWFFRAIDNWTKKLKEAIKKKNRKSFK